MSSGCFRPGGLTLTASLLGMAALPPAAMLLDAGCGAGQTTAYLRSLGYGAVGLDLTLPPDALLSDLRIGDMRCLPDEDDTFDGIITECSLSVCTQAAVALGEFYRVLKPGGYLLLSDVFFTGSDVPSLSLGQAATLDHWRQSVVAAGFQISACEDVSAVWQPFIAQCIWEERDLRSLWCGLAVPEQKTGHWKAGYFLLSAIKKK